MEWMLQTFLQCQDFITWEYFNMRIQKTLMGKSKAWILRNIEPPSEEDLNTTFGRTWDIIKIKEYVFIVKSKEPLLLIVDRKIIEVVEDALEISSEIPVTLKDAVLQLQEYFEGKRTHFSFTIHPKGTAFQQKVWTELEKIPYGTTCSYLDVAKKLGDVKAIRAVAAANGKNPLWIVVPCHRVIGSDGSLTGYAGGLWRKKWLLEHENPSAQKSLFSFL
jgi:methylated-DNA-[protein]-cysteine S-methyltransferase